MPETTDAPPSTKRYNDKREALIAGASALFDERGVIGTTLSEIAASVGLIKNSVTYYYRRKEDLAVACFMRAIAAHDALIQQAALSPQLPDRIAALMRLQFELQAAIAAGSRPPVLSFHEIRALPEPQISEVFSEFNSLFRRMRDLLRDPTTEAWPREHLNARTHVLMSMMLGVKPIMNRYEPEDYARACERLTDIVLHGVAMPGSTWMSTGLEMDWLGKMPGRDLQAQFLRVATELINEQGYAGASVNRIAEKMNLTKGGFYYYNDKKEELIAQCFERSVVTIRKAVNLTESYGGPAWEHLCSIARGLVRFQLSPDGPLLRSTANAALPDPEHRAHVSAEFRRVTERIGGVVVSGLIDGSIRPVDPALAAHVILSGIMAASELRWWVKSVTVHDAADLYARPLLMGLLSPVVERVRVPG